MIYGWTGKSLRVNLTSKDFTIESLHPHPTQFLGGKGINAKVLWDEVMPETKPFDPENRLIFGAGTLTGTLVPTSCKGSVTTKSPQTGRYFDSSIGGFWPAQLKFAGFDQLIVQGKAKNPSYLFINDGDFHLRDAGHLWGMDVQETTHCLTEELKKETDDPDIQILSIGVSGENQVYSAGIMSSLSNSASRGGVGAVMGSKNLKAIAVRGTRDLAVADPEGLMQLCKTLLDKTGDIRKEVTDLDEIETLCNTSTYGNHEELPSGPLGGAEDLTERMENVCREFNKEYTRQFSCFNCPIACRHRIQIPGQDVSHMHCEGWFNPVFKSKSFDLKSIAQLMADCQKLGLDYFAVTSHTALLMDLLEKGIISEKDTDGLSMQWGDAKVMATLAGKIARKEGVGEMFAKGIVNAAASFGHEAEEHVVHSKGMEVSSYSLSFLGVALPSAINERGDLLRSLGAAVGHYMMRSEEDKEKIAAYFPAEAVKLMDDLINDLLNPKLNAQVTEYFERINTLTDILGVCRWACNFMPYGIMTPAEFTQLISCVTGEKIDEEQLTEIDQRVTTLIRAFNIREGLRREQDTIPEKFFKEISPRWGLAVDRDLFESAVTEYYALRGWDESGFPRKETLMDLGLEYVYEDLQSRTGHYV